MPTDSPSMVKMRVAIRRLLDHHPLLGGLLAQWKIQEGNIQTMGVGWHGGRINLVFSPVFIDSISPDELESVLIHEARHVIYGHCFMDPEEWPDEEALTIAQEVTVNEGLANLPGDPILLKDHPELLPDTDTHERYAVLATSDPDATPDDEDGEENGKSGPENPNGGGEGEGQGEGEVKGEGQGEGKGEGEGDGQGEGKGEGDGQGEGRGKGEGSGSGSGNGGEGSGTGEGEGKGDGQGKGGESSKSGGQGGSQPDGDHDGWESILENGTQASAELRSAIREIAETCGDIREDEDDMMRARVVLHVDGCGSAPGNSEELIGERTREVSIQGLRQALARWCGSSRSRGARFDRPSRRMPALLGIVPAQSLLRQRVHVLAVIDTSGSMGGDTLASIATILRRIEDCAEITVVECDTEIQRVYTFSGSMKMVVGRGGTDFRPPLAREFLNQTQAEAVIYFTDGDGPAPDTAPHVPVIWALTHGGKPPTSWGKVLQVEA